MDFETFADSLEPDSVNSFYEDMASSQKTENSSAEQVSIDELLGIALGCIGMSRDDFERCTPIEFYEVWKRWGGAAQG